MTKKELQSLSIEQLNEMTEQVLNDVANEVIEKLTEDEIDQLTPEVRKKLELKKKNIWTSAGLWISLIIGALVMSIIQSITSK